MMEVFLILIFSFSAFSLNVFANLFLLLFAAAFSICFFQEKGFSIWGGILILIVLLTGLFIIFSYIVSTIPISAKKLFSFILSTFFFSFLFFLKKKDMIFFQKFFFFYFDWSLGGFLFMTFLLFIIIIFMRSTYNKGGGLRKKF